MPRLSQKRASLARVAAGTSGLRSSRNAEVAAAGLVDQVVKIVERAIRRRDRRRLAGIQRNMGKEKRIDAERLDVVEVLCNAMQSAAARRVEVGRIDLVDDGVLPPGIGIDAGTLPSGARKGLGADRRDHGTQQGHGENATECGRVWIHRAR